MKQKSVLALSLTAFILASACVNIDKIVITTPDLSKIANGEYRGNSKIGPVKVTLDVYVQNNAITSINIIKHRNGRGEKAEAITSRIIEAQSLAIDGVSGATYSSKAILKAAENALSGK